MGKIEQFEERIAAEFPSTAVRSGRTLLIDFSILDEVLQEAQSQGFGLLGLDGFKVAGKSLVPMMDYIVDFSSAVARGSSISYLYDATKSFIRDCQNKPDLVEIVLFDPAG